MPTTYPASPGVDTSTPGTKDSTLLEQLQKDYKYSIEHPDWIDIRRQAELDDRALSITGPWKQEDIDARSIPGQERPCIHLDQLSQYTHALINEAKSNPIAIKARPAGGQANEATAELRAKRIRAIEYESNGTQVRLNAFESMANRGFGFYGVTIEYKAWDDFQKVIRYRAFPNAYAILVDPDSVLPDWSDMRFCFVLSRINKDKFEEEYPDATITSFGEEHMQSGWSDHSTIQIAEYWHKRQSKVKLFEIKHPSGQIFKVTESKLKKGFKLPGGQVVSLQGFKIDSDALTLKDGSQWPVEDWRYTMEPTLWQCETNGLEILTEPEQWPGKRIPIFPLVGGQTWERHGNRVKRVVESYIRKGRDGQMLFDFYVSGEAELVGMTSKAPNKGVRGQFDGHEKEWDTIHKTPRGYIEYEAVVDGVSGVLPPPAPDVYDPPIQALEVGKESTRRSIQASIGSYGVTRLDDTNVKSGIALERLKSQNDMGSYHFMDAYKNSIQADGRVVNDLLDDVEGDPVEVGMMDLDGTYTTQKLNDPNDPKTQIRLSDEDQFEITISVGKAYQSQREESQEVGDSFIQNMQSIAPILGPEKSAQLLAAIIQWRQLGPDGDKIIDIIAPDPTKGMKPEQVIPQLQAQAEKNMQLAETLGRQVQNLKEKLETKAVETQGRMDIEKIKIDAQMAIAEINTKSQDLSERLQFVKDVYLQLHDQAHQSATQAADQAHQRMTAEQQAALAQQGQPAQP